MDTIQRSVAVLLAFCITTFCYGTSEHDKKDAIASVDKNYEADVAENKDLVDDEIDKDETGPVPTSNDDKVDTIDPVDDNYGADFAKREAFVGEEIAAKGEPVPDSIIQDAHTAFTRHTGLLFLIVSVMCDNTSNNASKHTEVEVAGTVTRILTSTGGGDPAGNAAGNYAGNDAVTKPSTNGQIGESVSESSITNTVTRTNEGYFGITLGNTAVNNAVTKPSTDGQVGESVTESNHNIIATISKETDPPYDEVGVDSYQFSLDYAPE